MKRRSFVKKVSIGSLAAPFVLNGLNFKPIKDKLFPSSKKAEDRVLILIRLNGGNDGLNTIIPLAFYDRLVMHRQNVVLPEAGLLSITPSLGMHPVMTGMHDLFQNGKLSLIQNVGYPNQNRSHFKSMDIWSTGSLDPVETRGWLGRVFQSEHPNFPDGYPNEDFTDPFAICMGYEVSATCQGLVANFSQAVSDPFTSFNLFNSFETSDGTYFGEHAAFLSTLIDQTNQYIGRISLAANSGSSLSKNYDEKNNIAKQLREVAKMISGGLKTKVYILNINGFDTHYAQVETANTITGVHASLLKTLSDAICAFQDDLQLLGIAHRVAGMTFSEFGRQIASNGSFGTDHGDAAPLFLFGDCISGGVFGKDPVIDETLPPQAGLPVEFDFRDIYASVLKDWFEIGEKDIRKIFDHNVTFYPILGQCNLSIQEATNTNESALLFPNPAVSKTTLKITTNNEPVQVQLVDLNGKVVMDVLNKILNPHLHFITIELQNLKDGIYVLRIVKPSGNLNLQLCKVH